MKLGDLIRWSRISLKLSNDNGQGHPLRQVDYNQQAVDNCQTMPWGIHGVPPVDTMGYVLAVNGNAEEAIFIPTGFDNRPSGLAEGELQISSPTLGHEIKLKFGADGSVLIATNSNSEIKILGDDITIKATAGTVTVDSPAVTFTGNIQIDGTLDVDGISNFNADLNDQNGFELSTHRHLRDGFGINVGPVKDP